MHQRRVLDGGQYESRAGPPTSAQQTPQPELAGERRGRRERHLVGSGSQHPRHGFAGAIEQRTGPATLGM